MAMRDLVPWNNRGREASARRNAEANPFLSLHREMNRLFDDVFRGFDLPPFGMDRFDGATGSWPRIEISETESEMKVTAELPGLDEKDVQVELVRSVVRRKQRRKIRTGCSANSSLARALSRIECGDFRYKRLPSQKIWMGGKALLLQPSLIRVVGR
jgi:HSP20 family protein